MRTSIHERNATDFLPNGLLFRETNRTTEMPITMDQQQKASVVPSFAWNVNRLQPHVRYISVRTKRKVQTFQTRKLLWICWTCSVSALAVPAIPASSIVDSARVSGNLKGFTSPVTRLKPSRNPVSSPFEAFASVAGFFPWFKGPPLNLLPGGCRYGLLITDLDNDHVDPTTPLPPTTTATSHHWSQPPPRANPLPFTHY